MKLQVYTECQNQHVSMIKTYGELAKTFMFQSRFQEAYDNVNKGLKMVQAILPQSLSEAYLLYIKGEIDKRNQMNAPQCFNEALEIYKKNLGQEPKHPVVPMIYVSLAEILLEKDEVTKALEKVTEGLSLLKQIYGTIRHPNQALALETQGKIFAKQGKSDLAKKSFEDALDILSKAFGEDNKHEITTRIKKSKEML